jgi:hypothetical protein
MGPGVSDARRAGLIGAVGIGAANGQQMAAAAGQDPVGSSNKGWLL